LTIVQGIPAIISSMIQDRTLERMYHDSLFPNLLFRGEAKPELWQANLGERQIFTRTGLIEPETDPLVPGQDPTPGEYTAEQWEAEARQFGKTIPTHMPTSYVSLASTFLQNTQKLGLHAAQTLNRLVRDRMFQSYLQGETVTLAAVGAAVNQIQVANLNGFTQRLVNGQLQPVSPSNPLPVTFTVAEPANTVIGFAPSNPLQPLGQGTLTLGAVTSVGIAQRAGVLASSRSRRLRVGGGLTVDGITSVNIVTLNTFISAVSRLRGQNVPPHADGYYHVHLTTQAEEQLFQDNHWQRLHQSLPDSTSYRALAIGMAVGCIFYRNTELPDSSTVKASAIVSDAGGGGLATSTGQIGGELTTEAGLTIRRALVTGGGCIYEKFLDESKFITEAGVNGKIGQFSVINGGVAIMAQRIRYILRAPQDLLQQVVNQTWSWSGDFPVPSDAVVGDGARFKRAVVIEHG
jgi:hypothetical protein